MFLGHFLGNQVGGETFNGLPKLGRFASDTHDMLLDPGELGLQALSSATLFSMFLAISVVRATISMSCLMRVVPRVNFPRC